MWALITAFALKIAVLIVFGVKCSRYQMKFESARWFGKVNTGIIEAVLFLLVLFPQIGDSFGNTLIALCILSVLATALLYFMFYRKILRQFEKAEAK